MRLLALSSSARLYPLHQQLSRSTLRSLARVTWAYLLLAFCLLFVSALPAQCPAVGNAQNLWLCHYGDRRRHCHFSDRAANL